MQKRNVLKTATISNARLCNEIENFGHNSVFNEERNDLGWDFIENATMFGVSGGFAFLSATTASPSLSRSLAFLAVDAGEYTEIVVKYLYKNADTHSTVTKGRVYFTTSSDPIFSEEKSEEFDVVSDGTWQVYTINMAPVFKWIGYITNLKIVFADEQGIFGDEIFVEYIRIQASSFTFCTENCGNSLSTAVLADSYNNQDLNTEPQNWSLIDTLLGDRTVRITRDSSSLVNRVVSLVNSSATSAGPAMFRVLSEAVPAGTVSFRFRPSEAEGVFTFYGDTGGTTEVIQLRIDSSGKFQYKSGPSTFRDFDEEPVVNLEDWNELLILLDLSSQRVNISLNGVLVGSQIPYLSFFPLRSLKIENLGSTSNSLDLDDVLIISSVDVSNTCPGIGRQGSTEGSPITLSKLDLVAGVNDSLIVNIDGYGDVVVTLPETSGATPEEVARLLAIHIGSIDLGGYTHCEVYYDPIVFLFKITSGSYGFDSSVEVKQCENSALAFQLGFVDELGDAIGTTTQGVPHSAGFRFSNSYRAKTSELQGILEGANEGSEVYHNPSVPIVEIGSSQAGATGRLNTLTGTGKTFVDFYHRATGEGRIDTVFFHGVLPRSATTKFSTSSANVIGDRVDLNITNLVDYNVVAGDLIEIDEPGYEGNGTYIITFVDKEDGAVFIDTALPLGSGVSIVIQSVAKVKHLRPDAEGRLTLINETVIGEEIINQLYSRSPDTYKIPVNWYLHRGDLIGVYNATKLYTGNDINGNAEALFVEYDGDLTGSKVSVDVPTGNGIRGIGLYGKADKRQDRAVFDFSFDEKEFVEYIEINGTVYPEDREYNLTTAKDAGFSLTVTVTGTHVHEVVNKLTGLTEFISHPNVAYNEASLLDGISYASNGYLGEFEQDVDGASYFYLDGDGEFTPIDASDGDAIEFPITGNYVHGQIIDFYSDEFTFDFSWNVPKTVHRYKMFYKEYPNVDNYSLEWLKQANREYDGTQLGFERVGLGNTSEFVEVKLDKLKIHRDNLEEAQEFEKHFQPVFDAQIDSSNPGGGATRLTYERNPFTVLDKEFDPVVTSAMRWHCGSHRSTKVSEVELYSKIESDSNLEEGLELYFSTDGTNFQKAPSEAIDSETVRFDLGVPIKYLRLVSNPGSPLGLKGLVAQTSDDVISYRDATDKRVESLDAEIDKGTLSKAQQYSIVNRDCETATVELSIDTEELSDSLILKTGLHTEEEVLYPEIGPQGIPYFNPDTDLRVTENVAINAKLYKLKNLASLVNFYEATVFETESDYFRGGLTYNKWTGNHQNFPTTNVNYGSTFPGFNMEMTQWYDPPSTPVVAEIQSKWNVLGPFSMFIDAAINPNRISAAPLMVSLGVEDATGRRIEIRKRVDHWDESGPGGNRSFSRFMVIDSDVGIVDEVMTFDQNSTTPSEDRFGTEDYKVPFAIKMDRTFEGANEVFKFSYVDAVNGKGIFEWDGNGESSHINPTPLVEPVKTFVNHYWSTYDGANFFDVSDPYSRIFSFNFSGNSSYPGVDLNFGSRQTTGLNGEVVKDNRQDITGDSNIRAIAVDLGERYVLDIIKNYTVDGRSLWNSNLIEFSNSETIDPNEVVWGNAGITDARWVLFKENPVPTTTTGSTLTYLDTLRIYPDITSKAPGRIYSAEWEEITDVLTDGDSSTSLTQLDIPVFAIDLGEPFEIGDYKLLDRRGEEFPGRSYFEGWDENTSHSQSDTNLSDPQRVNWLNWVDHVEGSKVPQRARWHAFKNETFDPTNGSSNPRYAATFTAKTVGLNSSGTGQYSDIVDPTEFARWFSTPYVDEKEESLILLGDVENVSLLYDSTAVDSTAGIEAGQKSNIFDGRVDTSVRLLGEDFYAWRVFGTLSGTMVDDSISVSGIGLPSTGSTVESQTVTLTGIDLIAFEVEMDSGSVGYPNSLTIQTLSGSTPEDPSNWVNLITESGLVTETSVEGTDGTTMKFNGGDTYRYSFEQPTTVSGFKVLFEDIEYGDEQVRKDISVAQVRALSAVNYQGTEIIEVSNDVEVREDGRRSLKLTYKAGNSEPAVVTAGGALELTTDPYWSIQDYLKLFIKIENSDLLDLDNCFIRIGKDESFFYSWPFSALQGDLNSVELNSYLLRFKEAVEQGIPGITVNSEDRTDLESKVNFIEGPVKFVQIELKPSATASEDISVWLDNPSIERENFNLPSKVGGTALYLNNGELLHYPMSNFDIRKGFFEAVITPDWNAQANTTISKLEAFTIFSAVNSLDESFSCIYSSFNLGLTFIAGSQDTRKQFIVGRLDAVKQYEPFKLSVAWDANGTYLDTERGSTVRVWINDSLLMDFTDTWDVTRTKDSYFFIGSRAPEVDVSINVPLEYPSNVPAKITPHMQSIAGGIENIILNSEPVKLEYQNMEVLKDRILLSLDGVNFYEGSHEIFPITIYDVDPGEEIDVWIKTNFPKDTSNLSRTAFLRTRWRRS
jgi:hypothetical protein